MSPSRRRLLATIGATTLAGCSGLVDGSASDPTEQAADTATRSAPAVTPGEASTGAHHDAANTGHAPLEGPTAPELCWRRNLQARPTPVGDTVLVGGFGSVHSLDPEDGRSRWTTDLTGDASVHAPALADGRVVALATDGTLAALGADDGEVAWSVEHEEDAYSPPVIVGDLVLTAVGRTVRADALADGSERWRYGPVGGQYAGVSALGVRNRDCYVTVAGQEPTLRRLTTGGAERWRRSIAPPSAPPVVGSDTVYVTAGSDTPPVGLFALDRATGAQHWERPIGALAPPAVADGRLFRTHAGGETVALDAGTGEQAWATPAATLHGVPVAVDAARVYAVGDESGMVQALSRRDGDPAWKVDVGFDVERVAVTDGSLYVAGGGWLARLADP